MLALYLLATGLILSGLLLGLTWFGGRIVHRKGPILGFAGAGMMAFLSIGSISYLVTYFLKFTQAIGWAERAYQLCFTAAVAIPIVTGLCCSLLLLWAAIVARRKKRRRIHQRS